MTNAGAPCAQDGCDGVIEGDGYCSECGTAAGSPSAAPAPQAPPPQVSAPQVSAPSASAPMGSVPTGSASSGRIAGPATGRPSGRAATSGVASRRLGAGLVDIPEVPRAEPTLLVDPEVEEKDRFCSRCGSPVGRGRDGRPGRVEGFCPNDGFRYSFRPKLEPGFRVGGQYEVQGCLAHGGLGWIYAARDRMVDNKWVVLKGLLNSGDAEAAAQAKAELTFLARNENPDIVTIHNFVTHPDEQGDPVGYIVMEYVGGLSLRQLMEQGALPDGTIPPLPASQAIAYVLQALPTIHELNEQGLAYNDFKPDNVIHSGRRLKLIDLGAVLWMNDQDSPIYGTIGYQDPAIGGDGPSPQTEVYTAGRTLAVLALGIAPAGADKKPTPLPTPADNAVLADHESLHRLLQRATNEEPGRRFATAEKMAEQLEGVLRDVLAVESDTSHPRVSGIFEPVGGSFAADLLEGADAPGRPDPVEVARRLPYPLPDTDETATGVLSTTSTLIRAHLDAGEVREATAVFGRIPDLDLEPWRRHWLTGLIALADGRPDDAVTSFDAVYTDLPGETAPKLAVAAAPECAGHDDVAGRLYALLSRVDEALVDAVFGLARVRLRAGDRAGARTVLLRVPDASDGHPRALAAVRTALVRGAGAAAGEDDLREAATLLGTLPLDPKTAQLERAALLAPAVEIAAAPRTSAPDPAADPAAATTAADPGNGDPLLARPWRERDLRLAFEDCLRTSARLEADAAERVRLVDAANKVRPRTWV